MCVYIYIDIDRQIDRQILKNKGKKQKPKNRVGLLKTCVSIAFTRMSKMDSFYFVIVFLKEIIQ